ncbi:MAG: ATP-binding cassette domain-containing protein [Roseiarcus sp.]
MTASLGAASKAAPPDQPASRVVVAVEGVNKTYSSGRALSDVTISCRAGEVRALLGENGAGKSTLVKIISGALRPDSGTVLLRGEPVVLRSPIDALRRGVGVVYQELTLLDNLRAGENVLLGQEPVFPAGVLRLADLWRTSEKFLRMVGLPHRANAPIGAMPIAQKQLLEVAKAISRQLSVLILDEPTSALGHQESKALFALIDMLKQRGLAIIYISHRLEEVLSLADTITVLKDGVVVADVAAGAVDESDLIRFMVGHDVATRTPDAATSPAAEAPALETRALSGEAFADVSFSVQRGEVLGVAGLLGSGAIDFAMALVGERPIVSGDILRDGRQAKIGNPGDARRHGVVYAPEDRKRDGLALGRTAAENISMGVLDSVRRFGVLSLGEERDLVVKSARDVALADRLLDRECRFLSGGQQQKVLLARCLATRSDVFVVAEPTRGVDVGARSEIYAIIHRLADEGKAIVVVSSDTREIEELCDRVLVFGAGRIIGELSGRAINRAAVMAAVSRGAETGDAPLSAGRPDSPSQRLAHHLTAALSAAFPAIALLLISAVFAFSSRYFLTGQNFEGLARQIVVLGLASVGQMMVILTGGIDLSIGATATLANLVSAQLLLSQSAAVAAPAALALGALVGAVNAALVRWRFPPFLATYAVSLVLGGLSLAWFPQSVGPVPQYFWALSNAQIGPAPIATLLMLAIYGAAWFVLWRTALGRHLFAFGRDAESARLSGIRPTRVLMTAYVTSGLAAAMVGVFLSARIGGGLPHSASGLELDTIAAVMLGGASLFGGRVTIGGTLAGVAVLTVIANGFNLMRIDPFYTGILRGLVMLVVVGIWALAQQRSANQRRRVAQAAA